MKFHELIPAIREQWADLRPEIIRHFALLWEEPELPGMERQAADALTLWLESEGFEVRPGVCGIPTAFSAFWGEDAGLCIALLAEYDALPGTANSPDPFRNPTAKKAGHACGHNQIGPANIGAAVAARRIMETHRLPGRVMVLGAPAEEILWGKVAMLKAGAFKGIDALLTSHADYQSGAISRPCQSVINTELVFTGESGHGGRVQRRNALDAAELFVQSVERLRGHYFPDTMVEHVLRVGGRIPTVTPDEARVWISTRQVDFDRVQAVYRFVVGVAEKAAETCGIGLLEQVISGSRGYLPNDVLARMLLRNLEVVGPPRWSANDLAWMHSLAQACRPNDSFRLHRELALFTGGHDPYGQDDGEVSWRVPLGRANWAVPEQVPLHNWAFTALSGHPASHAGPMMVSEGLALATVELLLSPNLVAEAKAELERRTQEVELTEPLVGAWRTMTETPERFWDASWIEP